MVLAAGSSWVDQTSAYADSAAYGLPIVDEAWVAQTMAELPLEPTLMYLGAILIGSLATGPDPSAVQSRLVDELFGATPIGDRARAFLRAHRQGSVFFEQQLYVAQRFAGLSDPDPTLAFGTDEMEKLLLILVLIADAVIDPAVVSQGQRPLSPDEMLNVFIAGSPFSHREWVGDTLTRGLAVFQDEAGNSAHLSDPQYCDLAAWIKDAHGITVEELIAGRFALAAASRLFDETQPFRPVNPEDLRQLCQPIDGIVDALVGDLDWFKSQVAATQALPNHAACDFVPFLQKPFWRRADGQAVPFGWRVVQEALGDRGLHFRFLDMSKTRGGARRYTGFIGNVFERYGVERARGGSRPSTLSCPCRRPSFRGCRVPQG